MAQTGSACYVDDGQRLRLELGATMNRIIGRTVGLAITIFATSCREAPLAAQAPRIEIRKVRTLTDHGGTGFMRAPWSSAPLPGGRLAGVMVNELPIVVDSTGRLVKQLGRVGQGPGEFSGAGQVRVGPGDTLFIANNHGINVFAPDLHFVRALRVEAGYVGQFLPTREGFLVASSTMTGPTSTIQPFHLVDATGKTIRSIGLDSVKPRTSPPYHSIGPAPDGAFWSTVGQQHRLERWTTTGTRTTVIDTTPLWFITLPPEVPGYRSYITSVNESNGLLWVMSSVPVPNAREIVLEEQGKKKGGAADSDMRSFPTERMYTSHLEVFDAKTGRLIANLAIPGYTTGFIDASHFLMYKLDANDLPLLEIWEMTLKR